MRFKVSSDLVIEADTATDAARILVAELQELIDLPGEFVLGCNSRLVEGKLMIGQVP